MVAAVPERYLAPRRPYTRVVQTNETAPVVTPASDEQPTTFRGWRRFLLPGAVAALVVTTALAGTFVFLWLQSVDTSQEEVSDYLSQEGPAVANVATEVATLLMNYDAATIDQRRSEITELSVGRFREQYEELLSQGLGAALEDVAASSRGQILEGPDVSFESGSEAKAIIRTSQTVQSNDNPSGTSYEYVMQLTMIDTPEEGWKVNLIEILSTRTV